MGSWAPQMEERHTLLTCHEMLLDAVAALLYPERAVVNSGKHLQVTSILALSIEMSACFETRCRRKVTYTLLV